MDPDIDPTDGLPSRKALARELLLFRMQGYFQDAYCASWLSGLEGELWEAAELQAPAEGETNAVATGKECRRLAEIAGGWWVWPEVVGREGDSEIFIPLEEWKKCLAKRAEEG